MMPVLEHSGTTALSGLLSGDGTLRLHGGDADGTFEWLLREGTEWATTEEVQSVVSLPAEPGVPVGRSSAASGEGEPFHWRCLDSTHQLACIRFVTRLAWVTGRYPRGITFADPQVHTSSSAGPGGGVYPRQRLLRGASPAGRTSTKRRKASEVS